jgi:TonB-dependent receptor
MGKCALFIASVTVASIHLAAAADERVMPSDRPAAPVRTPLLLAAADAQAATAPAGATQSADPAAAASPVPAAAAAAPSDAPSAAPAAPAAQAASPSADAATVTAADPGTNAKAPDLEPIVVSGIRASLEKSLDMKRDAAVILDSINALEMGRFPDADVADSLSHLPGITISRTTGGEGQKVSVRGLGPQYNIVTWNNRILATDDDGRDLAFDVLPSEVISGADVLKSPQASALEGSIGGTVNLRTASPFENPGFHGGMHAEGNYNQMSYLHGEKYSAFASDTNENKTLGFLVGAVHSDNHIRTDSLNAYNQNIYGPTTYPFSGGPNSVPLAATPCCITFGSIFDEKKRDALSGSVEWRPSDSFKLVGDGLWTRLSDPQVGYNESYYFASDQYGTGWSNTTFQNGVVTGATIANFQPESVNNTTNRIVDTSLIGLNATWKPAERLSFTGDVYRSKAKRPEGGADTFVTAGLVTNSPAAVDTLTIQDLPNSLPNLNVVIPPSQLGFKTCPPGTASLTSPGQCSYTSLTNAGLLNNNNYWSTHYVGLNGYTVHDQVTGLTLDGTYDISAGALDAIRFGIGDTRRDKGRWDSSNDWTNGSGQYGTLYNNPAGCPIQCNPYSFGSQGFNVISFTRPPNFMQGAGGSYPIALPQINSTALLNFLKSLNGKPNPFYCPPTPPCTGPLPLFNFAQTLPQVNPYNSYDVSERTFTLYGEADFAATRWGGNVGLRIVRTDTSASTAEAVPSSLWTNQTTGSTVTYNVQYPTSQPVAAYGQYTLLLPSANFNYWAVPEQLQLRLGLAETMSRPDLNQLAPTSSNNAINGQPQLNYGGTAGLRPIKALQADVSVEWYYARHAALTGALFGKKLRDDIYNATSTNVNLGTIEYNGGPPGTVPGTPFPWTVTAPANGSRDLFYGVELTWQHTLESGFGARLQYTHTYSKGWDQNNTYIGTINAVPPTTITVGLIYDKGPFSADVNWDHASNFTSACSQCTEVPNWPAVTDSFAWVTASAHYKVTKELEVYVEGRNLTDAIVRTYLNGNPLLPWAPGQLVGESTSGVGYGYSAYGRSYTAGFAFQF